MALTQVTALKPGNYIVIQGCGIVVENVAPYGGTETKITASSGRTFIVADTNWFKVF